MEDLFLSVFLRCLNFSAPVDRHGAHLDKFDRLLVVLDLASKPKPRLGCLARDYVAAPIDRLPTEDRVLDLGEDDLFALEVALKDVSDMSSESALVPERKQGGTVVLGMILEAGERGRHARRRLLDR